MKRLILIASLVFLGACGGDDLSSCTDANIVQSITCVDKSDKAAVEALTVGSGQQRCNFTNDNNTSDDTSDDKEQVCVETTSTSTTTTTS